MRQEVTIRNITDIGLIGLAVIGENMVLNMENKGLSTAVYNQTTSKKVRN
jgi:6-phosphogluconate dehydrogenase